MQTNKSIALTDLARAVTISRAHDWLNTGFGCRHAPDWMDRVFVIGSRPSTGKVVRS